MELELERGHDAEIAAAAPQRPEQVRVLSSAHVQELAVGRDDVSREQIVDGQSELARGPAEAAAQREAGDAGRSEERASELQSLRHLVCRLLLEKKKKTEQET